MILYDIVWDCLEVKHVYMCRCTCKWIRYIYVHALHTSGVCVLMDLLCYLINYQSLIEFWSLDYPERKRGREREKNLSMDL